VCQVTAEARERLKKGIIMVILATLLLSIAIILCGGTMLIYLRAACSEPSRVEEIRRLRQEGLAVHQEGEEG
jgi:hypothetical protein